MTRDLPAVFRELHATGTFVMPNPWDVGSAKLLAALGFPALATTSSGHAATLGLRDQQVTLDQLLAHAEAIATAVDVPLNVDAERCFANDPAGVTQTVRLIGKTGAAGCSIEDYDPSRKVVEDLGVATERVAAAATGCADAGMVLTARAEGILYGNRDLDEIITRLAAYRDAGAEVLYAPGLSSLDDIRRVVEEVGAPVNVLALPGGPTVAELRGAGVRRISTGGMLAFAAYGALMSGARELLEHGTSTYASGALKGEDLRAAFGPRKAPT